LRTNEGAGGLGLTKMIKGTTEMLKATIELPLKKEEATIELSSKKSNVEIEGLLNKTAKH
jgi:hypothetical protein